MPRYYFHLVDGSTANLVRDSAGAFLPNACKARREAIALAQDIIRHRLHGLSWQVLVTDADANVVLRVPFSKVRPQKIRAAFDLARRIALYEPRLRAHIFTWLLTAVVFALIMESVMLNSVSRQPADVTGTTRVCRTW
jgi:hypothetical protein